MLEIIRAVKVNCMCQCMQLIVYSVAAFMHTVTVSFYSVWFLVWSDSSCTWKDFLVQYVLYVTILIAKTQFISKWWRKGCLLAYIFRMLILVYQIQTGCLNNKKASDSVKEAWLFFFQSLKLLCTVTHRRIVNEYKWTYKYVQVRNII